mgnify:CR=1 FL=1
MRYLLSRESSKLHSFHLVTCTCSCNSQEAVRLYPASGKAHAGLGLVLNAAGGSHSLEGSKHLREALLWLPASDEGYRLRAQVLIALAGLHPEEVLVGGGGVGLADKAEASERAYQQSLLMFDLALQWAEAEAAGAGAGEGAGGGGGVCAGDRSCDDAVGDGVESVRVSTLMKKAWFCQGRCVYIHICVCVVEHAWTCPCPLLLLSQTDISLYLSIYLSIYLCLSVCLSLSLSHIAERHQMADALNTLHAVLAEAPAHMLAHLHIGNIFFASRQYTEALKW